MYRLVVVGTGMGMGMGVRAGMGATVGKVMGTERGWDMPGEGWPGQSAAIFPQKVGGKSMEQCTGCFDTSTLRQTE